LLLVKSHLLSKTLRINILLLLPLHENEMEIPHLMEVCELQLVENKVLRKIFG